ncbi:phage portal protein [Lactiplantibacillus plantarum]|nr:phage portal protein [Lactiplantibacillus plantarum]MCG0885050.1 phage portal protein [Lactiplantibacillus plantarum]
MGLATELQSVTDHKKVMADDDQYGLIAKWFSIYQSTPEWLKIHKKLPDDSYLDRQKMSLNMGQVAAKKMASLVFNQKAVITVSPNNAKNPDDPSSPDDYQTIENQFVQQTLKDNHFYNNFERYLEYMFTPKSSLLLVVLL